MEKISFIKKAARRCLAFGMSNRVLPYSWAVHAGTIVASALMAMSGGAIAQTYPAKPIKAIVTYPPGGTTDVIARQMAQAMSEILGGIIIVENKPGAGGLIGMDAVAKAAPDGYTLLISDASVATAPSLYKTMPFDSVKDLVPITVFVTVPHVVVVNPQLPANSFSEFVKLAKKEPGKLNFSSGGLGSPLHLAGELLRTSTEIEWTHIPYKGASPAIMAVVSGEAQVAVPSLPAALPQIKAGKMRALAVTTSTRLPDLPNVPTVFELGYRGAEMQGWVGLHAPAGTPKAIIARLRSVAAQALKSPALRDRLEKQGMTVADTTPEVYAKMVGEEVVRWKKVVKAANIQPE